MTAAELTAALFRLTETIDDCVHGADYLDAEVDQLIEAYRRLTTQHALLLKFADDVDAKPEDERDGAGEAIADADAALPSAQGKAARQKAIALTFQVGPLLKALLPDGNRLA